jgi:hypothetical protein
VPALSLLCAGVQPQVADKLFCQHSSLVQGLDLVFVAAYQHMMSVPFVDSLLSALRDEFAELYKPGTYHYHQFDDTYKSLLSRMQNQPLQRGGASSGRPATLLVRPVR